MNKTLKFLLTTFVALILIFNNLFSFISLNNGNSLNKVQAANLKVNIPLSFTPTHSIIHPSKPILYFTDIARKKAYSINYETGETKSIQFDLPAERITFHNDEVYVTLLKSGHQFYDSSSANGTGAVAIIDANNFTLKDRFDVNMDPFDIAVDTQGFIYLFGGSNQWTVLRSYSRKTMSEVSTMAGVDAQSYIRLNPNDDKLYSTTTATSPADMTAYKISNGKFQGRLYGGGYNSPYHGEHEMLPKFRISPDGKYIFNTAGTIFKTSNSDYDDLAYVTSLNTGFFDIAFDAEHSKFYTAIDGNKIVEHDYTNFDILKYHRSLGIVDSLFFQNGTVVAVSKDIKNKYFIESIALDSPLPVNENDLLNETKDTIVAAEYDTTRNKVYALNKALNNLFVMDAETNKLERTIKLSCKPSDLAISEDFSKLYIVNEDENYLVSEYDLNNFSNTRNLSFELGRNSELEAGHRHIYEKNNRLYVVGGEWSPRLLIFDATSLNEIKYSPIIDEVGGITFSSDGKYIYKWQQYGWSAGLASSDVMKYSIDGDKITRIERSNLDNPYIERDPLDTPIIALENKGLLIYKNKTFDLKDFSQPIRSFNEPIYAVDENRGLAVGSTKIYNLDTGAIIRALPNHNSNNMFFDKNGKLHLFKGKNMYSIAPLDPIGRLEALRSLPEDKEIDNPVDFPIVVQYPDKIDLVNKSNIYITDGKNYYDTQTFINENMLVIAHEDLPYNSKITLVVEEDAINSVDGSKFNNKFTLTFYTGKEYNRMAGLNRYETSIKVSEQWTSSKYAVLASGQDFPDALSASPLAAKYNAPILLTNPKKLDAKTETEVKRLGVSEMFIVGGYGSVSQEIENKLISKGIKVTRLHGKDRYETSMAIANFIGTDGELFIAAGSNFPDALSVASYAAAKGIPIILTKKDSLPNGFAQYVSKHPINKAYVIGGPGVINDSMLRNYITDTERIFGNNRYETNLMVLSKFEFYFGVTFIASGQGFADALSASALAGLSQSPIVLADKSLPYKNEAFMGLKSIKEHMKMKYTIGGEASVPSSVLDKIFK